MNPRITLWTTLVALTGSLALYMDAVAAPEPAGAVMLLAGQPIAVVSLPAEGAK